MTDHFTLLIFVVAECVFGSLFMTKDKVALYVAHNNPAASKVYERVGFAGLSPDGVAVEGVDAWTEIGFDRDVIDLGHW